MRYLGSASTLVPAAVALLMCYAVPTVFGYYDYPYYRYEYRDYYEEEGYAHPAAAEDHYYYNDNAEDEYYSYSLDLYYYADEAQHAFPPVEVPTGRSTSWGGPAGQSGQLVRAQTDSQAVAGMEAGPHFSYIVALSVDDNVYCGGWLLRPDIAITAASCLQSPDSVPYKDISVFVERYDLASSYQPSQRYRVGRAVRHPHFNTETHEYDIAMLKLDRPAETRQHLMTANLANAHQADALTSDQKLTVLGWGLRAASFCSTRTLKKMVVSMEELRTCEGILPPSTRKKSSMLCTSGGDVCSSDIGCPLVLEDTEDSTVGFRRDIVVGIMSVQGNSTRDPNFYVNISAVREWIEYTHTSLL